MDVLILTTREGDWEALYVNGKLIYQGHSIGDGESYYIWRKGIELGFTPDDIRHEELSEKDEEYAQDYGNMPPDISNYLI